ncbi:Fic/DOC family protein [Micromonospora kangleipakensis]|uniref:Fic/DOC family protein n=1 Tax=Micromonospora kangleipakensis TaxID=1077942 RepID=A0A4Q8B7X0_9ACTN|nr:Fic family protein [Micromonospora kangleipakensis]RZU73548.1 Fic/DOC family protein [Micromonospora kangleipakensis]
MRDDLLTWCRVREEVRWAAAARPVGGPVAGRRDGVVDFVRGPVAARDPARAARLLRAVGRARAAATAGEELSYELLAGWQADVLGVPEVGFRRGPAYAKGGRERYDLAPDTPARFRRCLAQAAEPDVPLAARAARAYLDVAFFHPFSDGNGRAAMLTLDFVLRRDRVVLDLAAPALVVVRRADDPGGAADLARLVDVLITATRRRAGDGGGRASARAVSGVGAG